MKILFDSLPHLLARAVLEYTADQTGWPAGTLGIPEAQACMDSFTPEELREYLYQYTLSEMKEIHVAFRYLSPSGPGCLED